MVSSVLCKLNDIFPINLEVFARSVISALIMSS
jgi:hypothetical protein